MGVFFRNVVKSVLKFHESHGGQVTPDRLREMIVNCGGVNPQSNVGTCPELTARMSQYGGYWLPSQGRALRTKEMARLQGFGDFTTTVTEPNVRRLIANAFTIPVLREVLLTVQVSDSHSNAKFRPSNLAGRAMVAMC